MKFAYLIIHKRDRLYIIFELIEIPADETFARIKRDSREIANV